MSLDIRNKLYEALSEQRETLAVYKKALKAAVEATADYKKAFAQGVVENKGITPEAVRKAYVEFQVFDLWQEAEVVEAQKLALKATLDVLSKELDVYRSLLSFEKEEAKMGYVGET